MKLVKQTEQQVLFALYGKNWKKEAPHTEEEMMLDIVDKITELKSEIRKLKVELYRMKGVELDAG